MGLGRRAERAGGPAGDWCSGSQERRGHHWVGSTLGTRAREANGDGPLEKVWHEGKTQEEAGAVQRNC